MYFFKSHINKMISSSYVQSYELLIRKKVINIVHIMTHIKNTSYLHKNYKIIDEECCICLENIDNTSYIITPCNHMFHICCLAKTIKTLNYNCPLCRNNFKNTIQNNNDNIVYFNIFIIYL